MKTRLLSVLFLLTFLLPLFFLSSCGSDDPDPHQVAEWSLDGYFFQNVPSAYAARNEGRLFEIGDIRFGNLVLESYTLTLNGDGSYTRKREVTGPNLNDNGKWIIDENNFTLQSDDFGDEEYNLERNENDQFWISEQIFFPLVPDAILDTLTDETLDNMTEAEINALFDNVTLDFVYTFEK